MEDQQKLNAMQRIIGVFFSPRPTFEDIDRKPAWVIPLVIIMAIVIGFTIVTMPITMPDQMEKQREKMLERGMDDDQIDQILTTQEKVGKYIGPVMAAITTAIVLVIFALVVWFIGNIVLGGKTTFKTMFSVYLYSSLIGMLGMLLSLPLIIQKQTANVHFSLALLLPEEQSKTILYNVLKACGVFSIWQYVVLAIGFAVIYKFSMKKAGTTMVVLFLFYVIFSVAMAKIFGL
ncbi:YIP1 family protein [candidate division KSB1 bacterium]|nr:YIP1 family protein [candidate division KSB1 bacterium]